MQVWDLHTDFQTVVDTIAYAKNLGLEYLADKGRAYTVEQVEWWIKGENTYYCPMCMNAFSQKGNLQEGVQSQEVLYLQCDQCQAEVCIPADAFAFESNLFDES